jgi:hypothetical protein
MSEINKDSNGKMKEIDIEKNCNKYWGWEIR